MTSDIEKIKNLHDSEQHQVFFRDEVKVLLDCIERLKRERDEARLLVFGLADIDQVKRFRAKFGVEENTND